MTDVFTLVWLTGASCDGCTIKALGDPAFGGIEALLAGELPGLPRIQLVHTALSFETGEAFVEQLRAAEVGALDPYALIVEASLPEIGSGASAMYATLGVEAGQPVSIVEWLHRLAPRATAVIAWGDCGVWGGPHALEPNPAQATGVVAHLGWDFRSLLGLPVIHLPGCAPPPVLLTTLHDLLRWVAGDGPPLALDELYRPRAVYDRTWSGAFVSWSR